MENLYDSSYKSATGTSVLSMVMRKVYGRMFLALVVTALTSLYVASSPAILSVVLGNRAVFLFSLQSRAVSRGGGARQDNNAC